MTSPKSQIWWALQAPHCCKLRGIKHGQAHSVQEFAEAPEGQDGEQGPQDMDVDVLLEGQGPEGTSRPEGGTQPAPQDKVRMTTRYLTKYERARVLGTRALQIRCGFLAGCCHGLAACRTDTSCMQHECAHPHRAGQQGARSLGGVHAAERS